MIRTTVLWTPRYQLENRSELVCTFFLSLLLGKGLHYLGTAGFLNSHRKKLRKSVKAISWLSRTGVRW